MARSYKEEKKGLVTKRASSTPSLAKAPGDFPVVCHTRDKRKQKGGRRWVYGHCDSPSLGGPSVGYQRNSGTRKMLTPGQCWYQDNAGTRIMPTPEKCSRQRNLGAR